MRVARALLAGLVGFAVGFAVVFEFWIPAAILVAVAEDDNMRNDKFLAAIILFALATTVGACACCYSMCSWGALEADDEGPALTRAALEEHDARDEPAAALPGSSTCVEVGM
jgi:O-antigen/teichoic acid export membrane protein